VSRPNQSARKYPRSARVNEVVREALADELERMNDPRLYDLPQSVEPAGARSGCHNEYGVYDQVGNLHEWVADPEGTFVGGFFMDTLQNGEGCGYRTRAHDFEYHDYSTGFRCCRDG